MYIFLRFVPNAIQDCENVQFADLKILMGTPQFWKKFSQNFCGIANSRIRVAKRKTSMMSLPITKTMSANSELPDALITLARKTYLLR